MTSIGQRLDDADDTRSMILCSHLLRRGHEVVLWTSAWDHVRKQWREEWLNCGGRAIRRGDGLEIRFMKGCGYKENISAVRLADHWLAARDFARQAKNLAQPDVIIASCPDHVTAAAAVRHGKSVGATAVIDICDKWPDVLFDLLRDSPLKRTFARIALVYETRRISKALQECDGIVAMMNSMLDWGLNKAGRSKRETDEVFYLTTSPKNTGEAAKGLEESNKTRSALSRYKGRLIVSYVGTFNNTQNPSMLLDAIDLLESDASHDASRVAFLIGGAGNGETQIANRAAAKPNVTYLGWLHSDEMAALLGGSDIGLLLLAKPTEAFNHKAFSYLASGLPILNTATGDLADLIVQHGIGVNITAGDPTALAKAIADLVKDPARLEPMKKNVRSLFDAKFDRERNYEAYVRHVEKLAASRSAASGEK